MKLYGFPLSPFVRKAAVALQEKGIEFDWAPSNPGQPDEEFLKASPLGKIPAIADGDFLLADCTAIITYLEASHPEPALLPADPKARGRAVWFEEVADTVLIPGGAPIVLNRFLRPNIFGMDCIESEAQAAEQTIERPLDYIESALGEDGWLDGEFSVGDIALGCSAKTLSYTGWSIDAERYPKMAAWYARLGERPAWKQVAEREAAIFASFSH